MKRFITVSSKQAEEVLIIMRNTAAGAMGVDAYNWVKKQLQNRGVGHHDQNASHQNQLPQQGGFVSFYLENGTWMKVSH